MAGGSKLLKYKEFLEKHERCNFQQSLEWGEVKTAWKKEVILSEDENGEIVRPVFEEMPDILNGETKEFYKKHPSQTAVNAIGYKELKPYLDGEKTLEECLEHLKQSTRRYAKRQLTWFNRNEKINWVYPDLYNDINELYLKTDALTEKFLKGE